MKVALAAAALCGCAPEDATDDNALQADPRDCPGAYASQAPGAGVNTDFEVAGQQREFFLMLPRDDGPHPLFVAFNGTSEDGEFFAARAKLQDFVAEGFAVVAPYSVGNGTVWPVWDALRRDDELAAPNADVEYFDALVPCLAAHIPIDKDRIYAGGHSAGGHMSNYLVQRRSDLLAGVIVASGVFDLTSPAAPEPLEDTFVLVTWGGDNDAWAGAAGESGISVPEFNFVEQAAIATRFYADEPAAGQAHCFADVGHEWLDALNPWMARMLLEHPKGQPGASQLALPPVPEGSGATCSTEVYEYTSNLSVTCVGDEVPACQTACQMFGDCAVVNATVGPVLAEQLSMLGFSGDDNTECGGCIERCEERSQTAADGAALDCIVAADPAPRCGPGIEGAQPLIDAVNECCDGRLDSSYCDDVCTAINTNGAAATFFPTCDAFE